MKQKQKKCSSAAGANGAREESPHSLKISEVSLDAVKLLSLTRRPAGPVRQRGHDTHFANTHSADSPFQLARSSISPILNQCILGRDKSSSGLAPKSDEEGACGYVLFSIKHHVQVT